MSGSKPVTMYFVGSRLSMFPSLRSSGSTFSNDLTPDQFITAAGNSSASNKRVPVMPRHVLLEGRMNTSERWAVLDVIDLPFSYHSLPYPLYRLCYKRRIKYVRFTVMSIYMSLANYPNLLYSHLYFPKMDFFAKPES